MDSLFTKTGWGGTAEKIKRGGLLQKLIFYAEGEGLTIVLVPDFSVKP